MRLIVLSQIVLLGLAGCVSLSSQPAPENRTTYVTPAPAVVAPPPPGTVIVTRP
jgi:hypothetical protein